MLLTITTPDHLLYGSDYPYVAPQVLTQSLRRMEQYLSDEPDLAAYKEMILHTNAERLLARCIGYSKTSSDKKTIFARLGEWLRQTGFSPNTAAILTRGSCRCPAAQLRNGVMMAKRPFCMQIESFLVQFCSFCLLI